MKRTKTHITILLLVSIASVSITVMRASAAPCPRSDCQYWGCKKGCVLDFLEDDDNQMGIGAWNVGPSGVGQPVADPTGSCLDCSGLKNTAPCKPQVTFYSTRYGNCEHWDNKNPKYAPPDGSGVPIQIPNKTTPCYDKYVSDTGAPCTDVPGKGWVF